MGFTAEGDEAAAQSIDRLRRGMSAEIAAVLTPVVVC